jgi:hypothetical protein
LRGAFWKAGGERGEWTDLRKRGKVGRGAAIKLEGLYSPEKNWVPMYAEWKVEARTPIHRKDDSGAHTAVRVIVLGHKYESMTQIDMFSHILALSMKRALAYSHK